VGGAQGTKTNWSSNSSSFGAGAMTGNPFVGQYVQSPMPSFGQGMSTSLGAGGSSYMNYNPGIRFNYNTGVNFMSGAL